MTHAQKDKNITDYNTFEVFEDIYNSEHNTTFDQLEMPEISQSRSPIWFRLSFLFFVIIAGLSIHPLLSYTLKTPYPLIVISDNTMQPALSPADMVVVKGVINKDQIKANDIIAYRSGMDNNIVSVKRVDKIDGNKIIVKGEATSTPINYIHYQQVIGRIIGEQKPFKIPVFGKISLLLAKR